VRFVEDDSIQCPAISGAHLCEHLQVDPLALHLACWLAGRLVDDRNRVAIAVALVLVLPILSNQPGDPDKEQALVARQKRLVVDSALLG
jgi:hypothetical protein